MAHPRVPSAIATAFASALYGIRPQDPAGLAARIAYGTPERMLRAVELLRAYGQFRPDGNCLPKTDVSTDDVYDTIVCPEGMYRKSRAKVAGSCAAKNIKCPENSVCVCSPCEAVPKVLVSILADPQPVYPSGRAPPCLAPLDVCASVAQNSPLTLTVRINAGAYDTLGLSLPSVVDFRAINGQASFPEGSCSGGLGRCQAVPGAAPGEYAVAATFAAVGSVLIEARMDGAPLPQSPFFVRVDPVQCPFAGQEPTAYGVCRCAPPTTRQLSSGECAHPDAAAVAVEVIAPVVAALVVLALCSVLAGALVVRTQHARKGLILAEKIDLDDSVVLGRGCVRAKKRHCRRGPARLHFGRIPIRGASAR